MLDLSWTIGEATVARTVESNVLVIGTHFAEPSSGRLAADGQGATALKPRLVRR